VRLVFLGTPQFACPALDALHAAGHEIACVVTQPDRPRGRGQRVSPSAVGLRAQQLGLPSRTLERGGRDALYRDLLALRPDAAIVVAFGHLIREPLLHGPRLGCLNLHASLLPRWRGAAPIQRAILAGDRETGVCLMQLEPELDTGPVFASVRTPIETEEDSEQLAARLSQLAARLLVAALPQLERGELHAVAQSESGVTHAPPLRKAEGSADLAKPAVEVGARIRALHPWPGVTLLHAGKRLKLLRATPVESALPEPGRLELVASELLLRCGQGALRLDRVQPEGRAAMSGPDYWRGAGARLGDRLAPLPDFAGAAPP
jgi:methionyl-tRNA formyltransferase